MDGLESQETDTQTKTMTTNLFPAKLNLKQNVISLLPMFHLLSGPTTSPYCPASCSFSDINIQQSTNVTTTTAHMFCYMS